MKKVNIAVFSVALLFSIVCKAQPGADSMAIFEAVNLYNRAWYEGDTVKIKIALHKELVKRTLNESDKNCPDAIINTDYELMVKYVGAGYGKNTPVEQQNDKITILDISKNIACVKNEAFDLVDYLQLAKMRNGDWKIMNVLWRKK